MTGTESLLESYWDSQCHFANTGTNEEFCDVLNNAGLAEHIRKMRHRSELDGMDPDDRPNVPYEFRRVPKHWNESRLHFINSLAAKRRLSSPAAHRNIRELAADNGETFFSEYYRQEQQRHTLEREPGYEFCLCSDCRLYQPRRTAVDSSSTEGGAVTVAGGTMTATTVATRGVPVRPVQLAMAPSVPIDPVFARAPQPHPPLIRSIQICCPTYADYKGKKLRRERVMGKPPHAPGCPSRVAHANSRAKKNKRYRLNNRTMLYSFHLLYYSVQTLSYNVTEYT